VRKTLTTYGYHLIINKLHLMELKFSLNAIHIREHRNIDPFDAPDCLHMNNTVRTTGRGSFARVSYYVDISAKGEAIPFC